MARGKKRCRSPPATVLTHDSVGSGIYVKQFTDVTQAIKSLLFISYVQSWYLCSMQVETQCKWLIGWAKEFTTSVTPEKVTVVLVNEISFFCNYRSIVCTYKHTVQCC